jgi:hypothetical protein
LPRVKVVDERHAKVLASRLRRYLKNWNYTFRTIVESKDKGEEEDKLQKQHRDTPIHVPPISIEVLLRNQEIFCVKAVPTARSLFFRPSP